MDKETLLQDYRKLVGKFLYIMERDEKRSLNPAQTRAALRDLATDITNLIEPDELVQCSRWTSKSAGRQHPDSDS